MQDFHKQYPKETPPANDFADIDLEQAHYYRLAAEHALAVARAEKPGKAAR